MLLRCPTSYELTLLVTSNQCCLINTGTDATYGSGPVQRSIPSKLPLSWTTWDWLYLAFPQPRAEYAECAGFFITTLIVEVRSSRIRRHLGSRFSDSRVENSLAFVTPGNMGNPLFKKASSPAWSIIWGRRRLLWLTRMNGSCANCGFRKTSERRDIETRDSPV